MTSLRFSVTNGPSREELISALSDKGRVDFSVRVLPASLVMGEGGVRCITVLVYGMEAKDEEKKFWIILVQLVGQKVRAKIDFDIERRTGELEYINLD